MMRYLVNKEAQPNGDHEVHKDNGGWCLPALHNRIDLGYCSDDYEALRKAKLYFPSADGCKYCCPCIHKH